MFNQFFPNKPPYVRVVNYEKKKAHSYYDAYQSPNDNNSYVLNNKLNNVTTWTPGKRCVILSINCSNPFLSSWDSSWKHTRFTTIRLNKRNRKRKAHKNRKIPNKMITLPTEALTIKHQFRSPRRNKQKEMRLKTTAKSNASYASAPSPRWSTQAVAM